MADTAADSATSTTAATTKAPTPQETKKAAPTRWADLEDEAPEEPSSSSTSEEKGVPELDVGNLKIDENKKINKFLDEPEDSNIKAV